MSAFISAFVGPGTFPRGVHPPDAKELRAHEPLEVLPAPKEVRIPLLQHLGAPCEPTVKNRQQVAIGETVGDSVAKVSAPVHASINGKAAKPLPVTLPNGRHVPALPIRADGEQPSPEELIETVVGGEWTLPDTGSFDGPAIIAAVRQAGIVGLGGAGFPTHIKLDVPEAKKVETLLVNGCECEPYLTADARLMQDAPRAVVVGAQLAARAAGTRHIVIAVEDNKAAAIDALRSAAAETNVEVVSVQTKYPQGGERQLVPAVLGRAVPAGGLPLDVGVVVINVSTSAAVARATLRAGALTHRIVTVSGPGIVHPKNVLCPVGVSFESLIDFCGGLRPEAARIIAGGPMMGFAISDLQTPITKGTSGITVLTRGAVAAREETACVRCGRCVDVCPLNLVPTKLALATRHGDLDLAQRYYIRSCMECGCCAYACPAGIPLVQLIRAGKAAIVQKERREAALEKAKATPQV